MPETHSAVSIRINLFSSPNPAKFSAKSEAEIIARNLRAESHVIGWIYLSLGLAVGVIVMFAFRCKSKYSYEQSNYIARYSGFILVIGLCATIFLAHQLLRTQAHEKVCLLLPRYVLMIRRFSKPSETMIPYDHWTGMIKINKGSHCFSILSLSARTQPNRMCVAVTVVYVKCISRQHSTCKK